MLLRCFTLNWRQNARESLGNAEKAVAKLLSGTCMGKLMMRKEFNILKDGGCLRCKSACVLRLMRSKSAAAMC